MCGIIGFSWQDVKALERGIHKMRHRGPDDSGSFVKKGVSLGHVRLSILDLSSAGHQPFEDSTGLVAVFNGEIYNFKEIRDELASKHEYSFDSNTDTEVFVKAFHCWGPDCVQRFNGMWAICIFDPKKKTFFLSRDRYGKKPLFYSLQKGKFCFASEMKSLLHIVKAKPNKQAISDFLYFDFLDHNNETFFKGISQVPAGHHAFFDLKSKALKLESYYSLQSSHKNLLSAFTDACMLRTVSDVPISLSLSGGVDSSSIAAVYADQNLKIKAFTTKSSTHYGDEMPNIKHLLKKYKNYVDLHLVDIDGGDILSDLSSCIYHVETPVMWNALARWKIARGVKNAGYKVLICGEGADEMLGGYASAYPFILASLIRQGRVFSAYKTLSEGKEYMNKRTLNFLAYYLLPKVLKRVAIHTFVKKESSKFGWKLPADEEVRLLNSHFKTAEEYFEYGLWRGGIPKLLKHNDRIPMAFGIEVRAPFMDVEVVERIMSIPADQRVGKGYTKYYFRKLMSKLVPKKILWDKKKIGYQAPEHLYLLSEDVQSFVDEHFAKAKCKKYVDVKTFLKHYHSFVKTGKGNITYLMKVISLELFLREFFP